jgi:hypothetical protein
MPAGLIHIQPDGVALQTPIKMSQNLDKSLTITPFGLNHPIPTQQRSHPSRNVQTFSMLAGSGHPQPLANASPTATQARMQGKPCLVLKDHCFFGTQGLKFFLKPSETAWSPPCELEDRHSRLASTGTPADASSAELASPLALGQTAALGAPPRWAHPNEHGLNRTLPGSFLSERQAPSACWTLTESADPTEFEAEAQLNRLGSRNESSGSSSSELSPRPRLSILAFAPQLPTTGQQSLFQSRPQEWSGRKLEVDLFGPRHVLKLRWGFS